MIRRLQNKVWSKKGQKVIFKKRNRRGTKNVFIEKVGRGGYNVAEGKKSEIEKRPVRRE